MKRLTALFFSLTMALGLAACGSGASSQAAAPSSAPASPASSQAASSEAASSEAASSEAASSAASSEAASSSDAGQADPAEQSAGNTLVVYYSATGNTGEAAGYIAGAIGADVFEIVPADPYTSEDLTWTDPESRVSTEHDARVAGETVTVELTQTTPDNWDSYYGPASLEETYAALHDLYAGQGLTEEEIGRLLVLDVRGQEFFSSHGFSDQHAGGQAFAHDPDVMGWLFAHQRQQGR